MRPPLRSSPRPRRRRAPRLRRRDHVAEVAAADDGGAEAGELALAGVGEAAIEGFGDDQAEDGVAEELELLVVGARGRRGSRGWSRRRASGG